MSTSTPHSDSYDELPAALPPYNQGSTSASWVMVVIIIAGVSLSVISLIMGQTTLVYVGIAIAFVGLLVGLVMARMGHGKQGIDQTPDRAVIEQIVSENK